MNSTKPRDLCERTFIFARDIVTFCIEFSKIPGACRQIGGQLLRAGTSVGANTEEAKGAYSKREFACKNATVLREAREARFWLRLIIAAELNDSREVHALLQESEELVGIFTATVRKSKRSLENPRARPRS